MEQTESDSPNQKTLIDSSYEKLKEVIEKLKIEENYNKIKKPLEFIAILLTIIVSSLYFSQYGIIGYIVLIFIIIGGIYILKIISMGNENAKSERVELESNDSENVQPTNKKTFTKGKIIKYIVIIFIIYIFFIDFPAYFVEPEISITSPQPGDIVKFDKDYPFLKISGNSKGLANNPFLHLNILDRRVDSNNVPSEWTIESSCLVYGDGSWECRYQPIHLYEDCINNTIFIRPPNNKSNNISTYIDIAAVISKQTIWHSILSKLRSGSFRDDYFTSSSYFDNSFSYYREFLSKSIFNAHITINPDISQPFNTSISCGLLNIEIIEPRWNIDQGFPFLMRVSSDWPRSRYWNGIGVEGANITLDNSVIGTTTEDGYFHFTFNISGNHNLSATKEKYISVVKEISIREPFSEIKALDINIIPTVAYINQEIVIKSNITNKGTKADTFTVNLSINNTVVDDRFVALAPKEVKEINFTRKGNRLISPKNDNPPGSYIVEILEQKKILEVKEEPPNYLLIGGLATGLGLAGLMIIYLIRKKRKR